MEGGCGTCAPNPCGIITILQGYAKTFYVDLLFGDTGEPFDLTSASVIVVGFPGASGTPVTESLANSNVAVVGAPGAGKISVTLPADDSALLLPNPNQMQFQDLQVSVTITGVVSGFLLPNCLNIIVPTLGVI